MISILMPIYNGIEFLNESVISVIDQTFIEWELLIAINGHPENSEVYNIAKKCKDKYKKKNKNIKFKVFDFFTINGKPNTLNELIKHCSFDYVAILDVDDIWTKEKLQVQSAFINKYDVIGSNCIWFGDRPGIIPKIPIGDISNFDFTTVNPIINSSSIIRKELCYWNNNGIEDYDMWLRLRQLNKKFYNCKEILVKHRIHNQSAFNSKGDHPKLVEELLKKYT